MINLLFHYLLRDHVNICVVLSKLCIFDRYNLRTLLILISKIFLSRLFLNSILMLFFSRFQKALYLAYFLVAILLIVVIVMSVMIGLSKSSSCSKTCTSKACIKTGGFIWLLFVCKTNHIKFDSFLLCLFKIANMILDNMNTEVDPCKKNYL